jgi:hypothetical protein
MVGRRRARRGGLRQHPADLLRWFQASGFRVSPPGPILSAAAGNVIPLSPTGRELGRAALRRQAPHGPRVLRSHRSYQDPGQSHRILGARPAGAGRAGRASQTSSKGVLQTLPRPVAKGPHKTRGRGSIRVPAQPVLLLLTAAARPRSREPRPACPRRPCRALIRSRRRP